MLQEVSSSVGLISLKSRSSVDPDPDGGGLGCEIRLGGDAEAVGKRGDAGLRKGEDGGVVGQGWEMELSLIGLQNAGKTSLVNVIATGGYSEDMIPTTAFEIGYRRSCSEKDDGNGIGESRLLCVDV
ncbi:uncharacterized protein A4U43_C03F25590 [Asparagus officinalis]|uniref:Uncharacterized protein n=1 Tax=Asparagus officinalis TaxID=4686 RepID=A0A5P1FH75_ASPOF|nr:uncharacterized protein A4U43_C03F25590 [Asparagus officinalis]